MRVEAAGVRGMAERRVDGLAGLAVHHAEEVVRPEVRHGAAAIAERDAGHRGERGAAGGDVGFRHLPDGHRVRAVAEFGVTDDDAEAADHARGGPAGNRVEHRGFRRTDRIGNRGERLRDERQPGRERIDERARGVVERDAAGRRPRGDTGPAAAAVLEVESEVDVVLGFEPEIEQRTAAGVALDGREGVRQRGVVGGRRDEPEVPRVVAGVVVRDRGMRAHTGRDGLQAMGGNGQRGERAGTDRIRCEHGPDPRDRSLGEAVRERVEHGVFGRAERSRHGGERTGHEREVALEPVEDSE